MAQAHRKTALPAGIAARLKELQSNAKRAAPLLKAMSNPTRLVILCKIAEGERSVGELEKQVGLTQSGISQHLAVLRRHNLVVAERRASQVYYRLAYPEVAELLRVARSLLLEILDAGRQLASSAELSSAELP